MSSRQETNPNQERPAMISINETNTDRTFGLEIEFGSKADKYEVARILTEAGIETQEMGYTHQTTSFWKIVYDSTVQVPGRHNMELVSPILKGAEGLAEIRKVCDVLNGSEIDAKVNTTCGLHVHHGGEGFNDQKMANLINLYKHHETELDSMVAPSRRGNSNRWMQSLEGKEAKDLSRRGSDESALRYHKVNLQSFHRHGTVEIRHMNGTTDADKICGWVVLTQAIVERALTVKLIRKSNNARYDLKLVLRLHKSDHNANLRKWISDRKAQLAA